MSINACARCLLLLFLLLPGLLHAQSKKELEERRKKLIREISSTGKLLEKTTKSREATYDRFLALQNQIRQRENLIRTLEAEIGAAERDIDRNQQVVAALERDLHAMQEDYGRTIRMAYRRKMLTNPLLYILSADNLNQAFRRWLYLRKYDRMRREQSEAIAFARDMLTRKLSTLEKSRSEKERLLASLQGQKTTLAGELENKNALLKTLTRDESKLRDDLKTKEAAHEQLNQAIEKVIQEEVRARLAEARRRPAPNTGANASPTPSGTTSSKSEEEEAPAVEDAASTDFRRNRGRLPWPVDDGFVVRGYGRQKHPTIPNIEITNNGIDIRTDASAQVRAVFGGRVVGVQFIPGHDYTVILQHGNYYTVYSNLAQTQASKGDQVKARQSLGRVSTNPISGAAELHFELWNQKDRLNPSTWIRKN